MQSIRELALHRNGPQHDDGVEQTAVLIRNLQLDPFLPPLVEGKHGDLCFHEPATYWMLRDEIEACLRALAVPSELWVEWLQKRHTFVQTRKAMYEAAMGSERMIQPLSLGFEQRLYEEEEEIDRRLGEKGEGVGVCGSGSHI